MKKNLSKALIVMLIMVTGFTSCKKDAVKNNAETISAGSTIQTSGNITFLPNFKKLADTLEKRLKGNVVGYSFVIYYKNLNVASRSGGFCRLGQDGPSRLMSINEKYSCASVSKTITAAALIRALNTFPNSYNMIDWPMYKYLPSHWNIPASVKTITFRQLLTHRSGFTIANNNCSYQDLKTMVENGVMVGNIGTKLYNNRNFALMRLLIPRLAQYSIYKVTTSNLVLLPVAEAVQAGEFTDAYKDYCRKVVFANVPGTANVTIDCKNPDAAPGLYYQFPAGSSNGYFQPDLSSVSGGQGWVLTTAQMADFFRVLHNTENILPKILTDLMRTQFLGYDIISKTTDGVSYYWKNGIHNNCSSGICPMYRSLIIGFGDDVQISVMTNSALNLQDAAVGAHQDWYGS